MTVDELYRIIVERKRNAPADSYVASLFQQGNDRIAQKVGEEAVEVVIAAKNDNKETIISESADLFFHHLILLAAHNVTFDEVMRELDRRHRS